MQARRGAVVMAAVVADAAAVIALVASDDREAEQTAGSIDWHRPARSSPLRIAVSSGA